MNRPMELYDQLLAGVSSESTVSSCIVGRGWTAVSSEGLGLAMSFHEEAAETTLPGSLAGRPLADLASYVRSWNMSEASLGMAAINAHYNTVARVEAWTGQPVDSLSDATSFTALEPELHGKKVAVIGHFPGLDRLADVCDLSIFERRPQPGDYPDFAVEYLLPEQDYVFITGSTLVNKTLPRLLELAGDACVVLTGPTVPLTPILFDWGVDILAGSVVLDSAGVWQAVAEGGIRSIWKHGAVTVQMRASDRAWSEADMAEVLK